MDDPPASTAAPLLLVEAYASGLPEGGLTERVRARLFGSGVRIVGTLVIPGDESVLFIIRGDLDQVGPAMAANGVTPIRIVDVRWYEG